MTVDYSKRVQMVEDRSDMTHRGQSIGRVSTSRML